MTTTEFFIGFLGGAAVVGGIALILIQNQINKLRGNIEQLTIALGKSAEITGILARDYAARSAAKKAGK